MDSAFVPNGVPPEVVCIYHDTFLLTSDLVGDRMLSFEELLPHFGGLF